MPPPKSFSFLSLFFPPPSSFFPSLTRPSPIVPAGNRLVGSRPAEAHRQRPRAPGLLPAEGEEGGTRRWTREPQRGAHPTARGAGSGRKARSGVGYLQAGGEEVGEPLEEVRVAAEEVEDAVEDGARGSGPVLSLSLKGRGREGGREGGNAYSRRPPSPPRPPPTPPPSLRPSLPPFSPHLLLHEGLQGLEKETILPLVTGPKAALYP
jgi:hypothetical protein